ncbi:MAG: amino acid ABC transporter substrate-binding protein [Betaproteobacteria bacterium]
MKRVLLLLCSGLVLAAVPALADTLSAIRAAGVIRMGYLEASPPFSYKEGSEVMGYSVGLCEHVARGLRTDLGLDALRVEWVPVTLANRIDMVEQGKIQIECGTTTWTFSRQKRVDFSLMTFVDGGSVLVNNGSDLFKLDDFSGKRIAVMTGTTTEKSLADALQLRGVKAKVVPVESAEAGIAQVQAGKVDGFASDRLKLIGIALKAQKAGTFRVTDEDFSIEPYALVLPRADPEFRLAVNRSLARLYRTGDIMQVYDRWLGPLGKPGVLLNALYYLQRIPE